MTASQSTAATAAEGIPITDSPTTSISVSNLEAILKQVLSNSNNPSPTALSVTSGTSSWFFDSACCNHMTSDLNAFSSKASASHIPDIHTADGSHMHVSHIGQVSTSNVTLSNTYLIPKLTFNLISVGQLCDLGLNVTFSSTGCCVQDPRTGQILGTGRKVGRLFELTSLHVASSPTSPFQSAASTSSNSSLSLWHDPDEIVRGLFLLVSQGFWIRVHEL